MEQLTPELCVAYRDDLHASGSGTSQQKHVCTGIRRVVTFAIHRALHVDELTKILTYLKLLTPDGSPPPINPMPIKVDDFKALLKHADVQDRAMILLMLNGALYLKEAVYLEWTDFTRNGCLLTNLEKTGKCIRAAKLWPETIAALEALPRKGNRLFYTYAGAPIKICGAHRRFSKLADAAGVPHVTPSHLRAGSATAAVMANVTEQLVNLMCGWPCGIADRYVTQNPAMVQPATEAIYQHYFAAAAVTVAA